MSVRTIVLFGALAWVSGSLLVLMNRGVLAEGRVAGVSITATVVKAPTGDAIVSLANEKTLYLRRNANVWRIADAATLQLVAKQVTAREGRQSLDGLTLVGTLNAQNMGEALAGPALALQPQEPVNNGDDEGGPTAGPLRLRVDSSTPSPATLPDGTQLNSVLAIQVRSFSGLPVNLTSLTLTQEYAYLASTSTSTLPTSTTFDGATAWDGTVRHGSRGVFGANLRATVDMSADPIVIPPLGTRVVLVKADLPTNVPPRMGEYGVRLAVSAAGDISQTGGTIVGAAFPLRGSLFSWVDGASSVGSVSVSGLPVGGYILPQVPTTTPNILIGGLPDIRLATVRLAETSSIETVSVRRLTFTVEGTVEPATDLGNFQLVYGSMPIASVPTTTGRSVTFNLGAGMPIMPGGLANFGVYAQAMGGAGRWFRLVMADPEAVETRGDTSGLPIYPTAATWPVASDNSYWSIGEGDVSTPIQVMRAPRWGQSNTAFVGETNTPISAYLVTNPSPESVTVSQVRLAFTYWSPTSSTSTIQNARLYSVASSSPSSTVQISNVVQLLGTSPTFTINPPLSMLSGATLDLEMRGDVASWATPGGLFTASMPAMGVTATGDSGSSHSGPASAVTGHHLWILASP